MGVADDPFTAFGRSSAAPPCSRPQGTRLGRDVAIKVLSLRSAGHAGGAGRRFPISRHGREISLDRSDPTTTNRWRLS
jgi:hypothetical protein